MFLKITPVYLKSGVHPTSSSASFDSSLCPCGILGRMVEARRDTEEQPTLSELNNQTNATLGQNEDCLKEETKLM